MHLIKSLWRGDVALWRTYWLFGVLGGALFNAAFIYIQFHSMDLLATAGSEVLVWALLALAFVYSAFVLVAIWRSANRYRGPKINSVLARIAVVLGTISLIAGIREIVAPRISESTLLAEARALDVQLPMMIDESTRFDRASANGLSLTYGYTIVDGAADEYDPELFHGEILAGLLRDACADLRLYLEADVRFVYEYRGNDGGLISTVELASPNCLGIWRLPSGSRRDLRTTEIAALSQAAFVSVTANPGALGEAFGSGFIVRSDGVVVTNLHIVEGADTVQVQLPDGRVFTDVDVLGADEYRDILVLKLPISDSEALAFGRDTTVEVGEEIFVLGNPLGFDLTFSDGLVSAIRSDGGFDYFQISAPISEGSSGGPVVNGRGEAIAIASMTVPDAQNVNLAVPVRYIYPILAENSAGVPFGEFVATVDFSYVSDNTGDRRAESTALFDEAPPELVELIADRQAWEQQVYLRLYKNESSFAEQGLIPYGEALGHDYLAPGEQGRDSALLAAGDYVVAAVCDDDCTDLDLAAYAEDGTLQASDEEVDAEPVVRFSVATAGTYIFETTMYDCVTDTCLYAMQVFAGD